MPPPRPQPLLLPTNPCYRDAAAGIHAAVLRRGHVVPARRPIADSVRMNSFVAPASCRLFAVMVAPWYKFPFLATTAKGEYSRRIVPANVSIEENQLWPDAHSWLSLPVCPFSCARRKQTKPKSAWGADDPTRAAFPFSLRLILSESGHEVRIFLLAEAASLMRKATANAILPVGWPPLSEALEKLVARHV
jgi:hypothetical protein